MADYDTVFLKHFYENFDFNKCSVIYEYNKVKSLTYSEYKIDIYSTLGTTEYIFYIKDKSVIYSIFKPIRNKYATLIINKLIKIESEIYNKEQEKKIAELNTFLESIHS